MKHLIIGKGKLGTTIKNSLEKSGERTVSSLTEAECVWIVIPDSKIGEKVKEIEHRLNENQTLIHCSGSFPSSIMKNEKTEKLASLHPAYSFSEKLDFMPEGILWTLEGKNIDYEFFKKLISLWKGKLFRISETQKPLYHIACVFYGNLALIPMIMAEKLLKECGIPSEVLFKSLFYPLSEKLKTGKTPYEILTGPAKRKDLKTVENHIKTLEKLYPDFAKIYKELSEFILHNL